MAEPAWKEQLSAAESALKEDPPKYFDGVQFVNSCMELYSKEVLGEDRDTIVKDPQKFCTEMEPKLTLEQKEYLQRMYEVRGDIITGLGAHKRAGLDYFCAQLVGAKGEELAKKRTAAEDASQGSRRSSSDKVPVTVITGFLGSGKTTLLNRILKDQHGKKIAVIENEFGEVGIDDALIENDPLRTEENLVEMNNGCICCTVRGDLIAGLKKLVKNSQKKSKPLDAIIIETTGLADPGPVAQTFFADEFVQQKLALDGILTLADAKHLVAHLDEEKPEGVENEAVEQIAFADRIILNKCDLVSEAELDEVEKRIRRINEAVQIRRTKFSEVDMDFILGIQSFNLDKILEMNDAFLADNMEHSHDDRVSSVGFHTKGEVDQTRLNEWIGWLLREKGNDIFRTKGVLAVQGMSDKFVFQAVHMAFSGAPQKPWGEDEEKVCKLTFIGKNLNRQELVDGFQKCLVQE